MENDLFSLDDSLFLKKDIIEYKCRALWFSGQIEPLIMLAADYLVENPESYLCLPMDGLVDIIGRDFICTIESIIICHFYVKFISEEKRATLNELFEELIFSNGCSKPSDMFESLGELPSSKRLLFLQHICTYENLDFLSVFQSSDELRAERIKILENLYAQKLIAREPYFNELELIIRQVVMDSATSSFSRSKIFVDHDAIKRKVIPEVRSLLEIFKASIESSEGDEDEDALIILNESSRAENIGSAMLPGRRNSLLVKILEQVRDCFLFDETFGLDSNLSAEIRHGIFSNFIRSEIDSRKLITERTSSGEYEANRYWRGVYSDILTPRFLGVLNAQLAWFSENFNLLVSNAEKWMKISTTLEDSYSAFRYITHLEEFTELRESALSAHGPEDLIDEILDWLWSHTEANLEVMKERINDGFKNSIDSLFDELADRINNVKGDAELKDLMGSIHAAKNSTREIIREISEWFSRSESKTFDAQELGQLIDISISCFEKIKGRNFNIEKEVYPQVAEFFIPGNFVNSMILAMINLLTNCTRHSGLGEDVPIYISVKPYISGFVVEISNGLSQERLLEITQDFVEQKNASFSSDDTLELLRSEGGTGLAKAFHHLKSASPGFNLKVQKQDEFFSCEVTYESVDLVG
ncbi:hypothetical protein [Pseudomonas sp. ANT_H12B]|uniref:hypothetical protein n=1 Tax=Pseudomonas sp. ANT_H12B TaxID=2597348 RepID=UPI0011EE40C6|nr:hypothetical protein [Pseudomonas sp. ANT_H12B]KAA0975699.1 hypothetical protein FQ185_09485 [Pseudomonas sp. ANT_H12B]